MHALVLAVLAVSVVTDYSGKLTAGTPVVTAAAVVVPLEYLNDSQAPQTVRVECVLKTRRGDVVSSGAQTLRDVPTGTRRAVRLRIDDTTSSGDAVRCAIQPVVP